MNSSGSEKCPLVIRFDDIGASSKKYEVYSLYRRTMGPLGTPGDWLFLKYLPGLKAWGPYREIRAPVWKRIIKLLERYDAKITLGVTATWVESEERLIPYPSMFPEEAALLKNASRRGLIEIANHGLTHCVVEGNAFKPKPFSGNRRYHREFSALVSDEVQSDHLRRSQDILQSYFETEVVTFVPPGRNFSSATLASAMNVGLKYVLYNVRDEGAVLPISGVLDRLLKDAKASGQSGSPLVSLQQLESMLARANVRAHYREMALHDRDLVMKGLGWFEPILQQNQGAKFLLARDAGSRYNSVSLDS